MSLYIDANEEQMATMYAFEAWLGMPNVFVRPTDSVFTIHCYMGNYDLMTEHVVDADGWTDPPFNDWDIATRDDHPFEAELYTPGGLSIRRVRAKR